MWQADDAPLTKIFKLYPASLVYYCVLFSWEFGPSHVLVRDPRQPFRRPRFAHRKHRKCVARNSFRDIGDDEEYATLWFEARYAINTIKIFNLLRRPAIKCLLQELNRRLWLSRHVCRAFRLPFHREFRVCEMLMK